jgi:hypothetical protein
MSALSIQPTYPIFTDIDGQPLEAGYIFIGTANLNPITNPINVYWDAALTQPAAQPIRTVSGYPSNAGTPARLYVGSDYSIQIQNKNGTLVYSAPTATERYAFVINADGVNFTGFKGQVGFVSDLADDDGSDWVGFEQAGANAVARSAQDKMRDVVSVKDFGAVGDNTADDTDAFEAAIATGKGIYIPAGTYRLTRTLDTRSLGLGNGKAIIGAGRSASVLNFVGVSGLFVDNEMTFLSSFTVNNANFVRTGTPAVDKLTIAAGIFGIRETRSHITMQNILVVGFANGIYAAGRYYNLYSNVRCLFNLVGFYAADLAGFPSPQFQTCLNCDFNDSYDANVYIERGLGWDFYSCSFELCYADDNNNANYPNGGVYVASTAQANFQNCWIEEANIFLDGPCNVSTNNWRKTWLGSPCNIDNYFTERKTINLVEPIYTAAPAWPDTISDVVISKSNANLSDGKRYTSIIDSRGSGPGTTKTYSSAQNEDIRGLFYAPNTFGGWVHAGIWVQFKTADVANFFIEVEFEDINGTFYSADTQSRLQPTGKPNLTLVDQWQYVGYFAPIRESFKTAFPLRRVRMRIRAGGEGNDYSGSPREYWLAEPTLRMFVTEGQPLVNSI